MLVTVMICSHGCYRATVLVLRLIAFVVASMPEVVIWVLV